MAEEKKKVQKVDVVYHEGPLMLPKKLSYEDAIEVLQRKAKYEQEEVQISETIKAYVWDGAIALTKALEQLHGFVLQQEIDMGFFGKMKPKQIHVATGLDTKVAIPWGRFSLPGIDAFVDTGYDLKDGMYCFKMTATTRHKHEGVIQTLFERVRQIATQESIYKGKAMSIKFFDDDGDRIPIPTPEFLKLSHDPVILNEEIRIAIEENILTPIQYSKQSRLVGASLKRGNLLAGPYGTGKTLTANWIAKVAVENSWTYFYVKNVKELPEALNLAVNFQPVVIFGEDLDRVAGQERTDKVNEIMNTLDGIGTKNSEIITVLTTNHPENINEAMRRNGRIDMTLKFEPPDADSVIQLLLHYGSGLIKDDEDLHEVGMELNGEIPAMIREVVERSKLGAIRRSKGESFDIMAVDLLQAARVLKKEKGLYISRPKPVNQVEELGKTIAKSVAPALVDSVRAVLDN